MLASFRHEFSILNRQYQAMLSDTVKTVSRLAGARLWRQLHGTICMSVYLHEAIILNQCENKNNNNGYSWIVFSKIPCSAYLCGLFSASLSPRVLLSAFHDFKYKFDARRHIIYTYENLFTYRRYITWIKEIWAALQLIRFGCIFYSFLVELIVMVWLLNCSMIERLDCCCFLLECVLINIYWGEAIALTQVLFTRFIHHEDFIFLGTNTTNYFQCLHFSHSHIHSSKVQEQHA